MSHLSTYPPPVQKILQRLERSYGDSATNLAVQALEEFSQTANAPLLRLAYTQCYRQTGEEWVHQALLYNIVQAIEPGFTYKPHYKTWPKFLLAQTSVFETQIMKGQLYVHLIPSP